jgi:hypothetical protein
VARIRYIKPEFFDDEDLASTSPHARLAFAGLWGQADREGRLKDEPGRLRVRIFPFEPMVDMNALLDELASIGSLVRYETDGIRYLSVPGFEAHQKPHPKEPKSKIPAPTKEQAEESRIFSRQNTAGSGTIPSSTGGREGNSTGTGRGGGQEPPPPPPARPLSIIRPRPAWAEWVGDRLHVPTKWHETHLGMLGGPDADKRLRAWYEQEDAHLMRAQTPVRDWFKWLDARYRLWVPDTEADDPHAAVQREIDARKREREALLR